MIRQPVASSDLHAVGYDAARQILEVEFRSGGIYQYFSVPPRIYDGLMQVGSKGRYFHAVIKGRYAYQKVG